LTTSFPFLTAYDPPGSSEGTLDPLGLYQIADQLAVQLVPAVRERMQRIRFLTAMAVGSLVTEGMKDDHTLRDASPYLVWEWLVVESLVRTMADDPSMWGVAGTLVTKRARQQHGYLDARSYLKTPRIFGFHGIYKRLAIHLGLVSVDLEAGPNAEKLVDAWARGLGYSSLRDAKPLLDRWRTAVTRSLAERPPRTKPGWTTEAWAELAGAFGPSGARARERRCLEEMLHASHDRALGALPPIWQLQERFTDENFSEELLHDRLEKARPDYVPLLNAIRRYELFARGLQDAFDVMTAEAARLDANGFDVKTIASDKDFTRSIAGIDERFATVYRALGEVAVAGIPLQSLFDERFQVFAAPMDAAACAVSLCEHHEKVQRAKSADGKRPWFDRLGQDRIYIRHAFREERREIVPDRYVHDYRGRPIRRFRADLRADLS
jgi:hypothetical protein